MRARPVKAGLKSLKYVEMQSHDWQDSVVGSPRESTIDGRVLSDHFISYIAVQLANRDRAVVTASHALLVGPAKWMVPSAIISHDPRPASCQQASNPTEEANT